MNELCEKVHIRILEKSTTVYCSVYDHCIVNNFTQCLFKAVLWIRIRMDPELLPRSRSGSGIIVQDPDPAKYGKQINKNVISL